MRSLVAPRALRSLAAVVLGALLLSPGSPASAGPAVAVSAVAVPVPAPVVPVGAFGWPLPGVGGDAAPARAGTLGAVARRFDPPPHYYGRGHRGADLVGRPGIGVVAAGDGVVVFAGRLAGRGVVSVEHPGGWRTTYEPVAATVAVGTRVRRGDPLGVLEPGHAGCPVAACLHWGLRRPAGPVTEYLDPLLLLGLGRVRLLPAGP